MESDFAFVKQNLFPALIFSCGCKHSFYPDVYYTQVHPYDVTKYDSCPLTDIQSTGR
jgi:hypothetical protein